MDDVRWNDWITVRPVRFDDEEVAQPRRVRLACTAMRAGDPVRVERGPRVIEGEIVAVAHSIVHVRRIVLPLEPSRPMSRDHVTAARGSSRTVVSRAAY